MTEWYVEKAQDVPYIVYEGEQARSERHIKRLWIALIIVICALFLSNAVWLWCWMQYDYTSEETVYSQDGQGTNIIGDFNDVTESGQAQENKD
jgi:hypothetical protein